MFYCLDRIEDGGIAVLTDEKGCITNAPLSLLSGQIRCGAYYTYEDGLYIYNEKKTEASRLKAQELLKKLRNKKKN